MPRSVEDALHDVHVALAGVAATAAARRAPVVAHLTLAGVEVFGDGELGGLLVGQ